jgi:hypothetical protein
LNSPLSPLPGVDEVPVSVVESDGRAVRRGPDCAKRFDRHETGYATYYGDRKKRPQQWRIASGWSGDSAQQLAQRGPRPQPVTERWDGRASYQPLDVASSCVCAGQDHDQRHEVCLFGRDSQQPRDGTAASLVHQQERDPQI